ncbi:hypothetical protein, partial [Neisseria meningitidis]|uniref:hypothetical protein n=1 Tax=Neisseria meningitidis TaxID=487 RepID=UPI001C596244
MKSSFFLVFALVGTAVAFPLDGLFKSAQETANSALKNLATKAVELKLNVTAAIQAGGERHQAAIEAFKTKIEETLGNAAASNVIDTIVNAINAAEEQIESAALSVTEEIAAATEAAVAETTDAETTDAE